MFVQLRAFGLDSVERAGLVAEIAVGGGHGRARDTGETFAADGVRQHVCTVHVLETIRVRRSRVPDRGPHVRRDILGHQPGLRGGFFAMVATVLLGSYEKTVPVVGAHQTFHDGHDRVAEEQLHESCGGGGDDDEQRITTTGRSRRRRR